MATSWNRKGPYEKALVGLCNSGDVTPQCVAADVHKKYIHCWAPIKLGNFRKHFKRVTEQVFGEGGTNTIPNARSLQPAGYGPGPEVVLNAKSTDNVPGKYKTVCYTNGKMTNSI